MSEVGAPGAGGDGQAGERGFQFPGSFEVTVVGNADAELEQKLRSMIGDLGMHVLDASVRSRASGQGNYVSVSVEFTCPSRDKLEALHAMLRADADIHYTH